MSDDTVRCAVVGCGRIGSTLEDDPLREKPCTHAGAIKANPECELVGGCDIDGRARADFAARHGVAVYDDVHALLEERKPELLCIATYPQSHYAMVKAAADAGVPAAVCEKPLAHTLRDGTRIAALHRRGAIRVITNHERRYSRDYLAVREAVAQKRYGALLGIRGTLYFSRAARHDRVLMHDGTHLIDAISFLTGAPVTLKGSFGRMRSARSSAYLYGKSGEVPVVIDVGAERDHLCFELELSFVTGRITVGNGVYRFEESRESPYYEGYRSLADTGARPPERTGYFANMLADAVRCARDPAYEPLSSAVDGLEALRFIRSARRGKAVWRSWSV